MSRTSNRSARKRSTLTSARVTGRMSAGTAEPTAMPLQCAELPEASEVPASETHEETAAVASAPNLTTRRRLPGAARPRRYLGAAVLAALGLLGSGAIWLWKVEAASTPTPTAQAAPAAPAAAPAMVDVAAARQMPIAPQSWVSASVHSRSDARLAAEVGGRVLQIAEVGDQLQRGAPLARLDASALQLSVREQQARIGRLDAEAEQAARQLERFRQLGAAGHVSGLQLDEAQSRLAALNAQRREAEAALAQIRLQVERSTLRAPFDGVVVERFAQGGELLGVGAPLLRLVDTGDLEVRARAPVALAAQLATGIEVELRAGDATHRVELGTVVPVGDEVSRQLELRAPLSGIELPIGSALELALPTAPPRQVLAVPRDALVLRREGNHVLRINADSTAQRVAVEIGEGDGDWVEVRGALADGDQVVVRGGERLREGQTVAIFGATEAPHLAVLSTAGGGDDG